LSLAWVATEPTWYVFAMAMSKADLKVLGLEPVVPSGDQTPEQAMNLAVAGYRHAATLYGIPVPSEQDLRAELKRITEKATRRAAVAEEERQLAEVAAWAQRRDTQAAHARARQTRWMRAAVLIGSIFAGCVLVALLAGQPYVAPFNKPGVAGKTPIEISLVIMAVAGWALGTGIEQAFRVDPGERAKSDGFYRSVFGLWAIEVAPRLFGGIMLVLLLSGVVIGLEAVGIGGA
jgi:hypothetical protein